MQSLNLSCRLSVVVVTMVVLMMGCREQPIEPEPTADFQYLEGEKIPNTEYFFPMAFYDHLYALPAVSPDGRQVAYRRFYNTPDDSIGLYVVDLETGEKRLLVRERTASAPDWSPNGEWIAFNIYPQIYKIKINGDSLTKLTNGAGSFDPKWSPDGRHIAFGGNGPYNFMKSDGTDLRTVGDSLFRGAADWHPDGIGLLGGIPRYSNSEPVRLALFNLQTNRTETVIPTTRRSADFRHALFSPDGLRISFSDENGIWVMNSDGSNLKRILPFFIPSGYGEKTGDNLGLTATPAAWHPDGKHLIYEHFRITRFWRARPDEVVGIGLLLEGYFSLYKVNVDSAIAKSTLP